MAIASRTAGSIQETLAQSTMQASCAFLVAHPTSSSVAASMCIPAEVENVLAEHAGVKEVVVVGFTKWREGEEIAAFVVPSGNLTEAELIEHCRARLSPDKRPRKFVFATELPRNVNGKISRAKLRQQLENAG